MSYRDPRDDLRLEAAVAVVCLAIALVLLVLGGAASAASPPSLLRCTGAHTMDTGSAAPCAGLLVPEAQALEAAHCVGVGLPTCRVELLLAQDTARVARERDAGLLAADALEIAALRQALAVAGRPVARPWYEHPVVVGVAAGVVGAGLGGLVVWAVVR